MSTQEHTVVDIIGVDHDGAATLIISEHREWDEESEFVADFERKLSAYMTFIMKGGLAAQPSVKP